MAILLKNLNSNSHDNQNLSIVFESYQAYNHVVNLSKATIDMKQRDFKKFISIVGDINIKEINSNHIISFILECQKRNNKATSINIVLRDMKAFFNWCYENNYIDKPIKIKLQKEQETIKETYSNEQLQRLLQKPDLKRCTFAEYRVWVTENVLLSTGVRCNTLVNIKVEDVDLDNKLLNIREIKTKKQQIVPLSDSIVIILKEYIKLIDLDSKDYLIVNDKKEQITRSTLSSSIREYNLKRDVSITSIHAFRHTFAKMYIINGGDVFKLQKLLGHSTLEMTRRYVNLFSKDLQKDYNQFNPLETFLKKNIKTKVKMKR